MREIRTSGLTRGSGRKALLRKRHLSLSTLPAISNFVGTFLTAIRTDKDVYKDMLHE